MAVDLAVAPAPVVPAAPAAPAAPEAKAGAPVIPAADPKNGAPAAPAAGESKKPPAGGEIEGVKKEENPANPEKPYRIKVEGKEYSLSLDELQRYAQKGFGSEKKFQEASKYRQQAENLIRALRENPRNPLLWKALGKDFKQVAQEALLEEIEREKLTPAERELAEAKEKLRQMEEDKKTEEQKAQEAQMSNLVKHYNEQYDKDITDALSGSQLPKTPSTVKRMAYYLAQGLKNDLQLKAADVVEFVRKDYMNDIASLFGSTDADAMANFLGEENLKKIREWDLKRLNLPTPPGAPEVPAAPVGGERPKLSKDEWRARLDQKIGK